VIAVLLVANCHGGTSDGAATLALARSGDLG